jgi:hypothetical protein
VTANTSASSTAVYLMIVREVHTAIKEETADDDPFHLEDDPAQSRHRFRHVGWGHGFVAGPGQWVRAGADCRAKRGCTRFSRPSLRGVSAKPPHSSD